MIVGLRFLFVYVGFYGFYLVDFVGCGVFFVCGSCSLGFVCCYLILCLFWC